MTKDEAAEAGVLVEALDDARMTQSALALTMDRDPNGLVEINHFECGIELGAEIILPAWIAKSAIDTMVSSIQIRLAALDVDTSEPEAEEG